MVDEPNGPRVEMGKVEEPRALASPASAVVSFVEHMAQTRRGGVKTKRWVPRFADPTPSLELRTPGNDPAFLTRSPEQEAAFKISAVGAGGKRGGEMPVRCWLGYGLLVIATIEATRHGPLLHVSVSVGNAWPGYPILIAIKHALFPDDVAAVIPIPEREIRRDTTLHVWQLPEPWSAG